MVEGRPDWVLSRQRAWGVPITLFVKQGRQQYLADPAVNARIIAGVRRPAASMPGPKRARRNIWALTTSARTTNASPIFSTSGSIRAAPMPSCWNRALARADAPAGHQGPWADLYLEGSDQHRGWFQSRCSNRCGTRGHAPYKAVLTHGFTMDQQGHENVQVAGQHHRSAQGDGNQRRGYHPPVGAVGRLHRGSPHRR